MLLHVSIPRGHMPAYHSPASRSFLGAEALSRSARPECVCGWARVHRNNDTYTVTALDVGSRPAAGLTIAVPLDVARKRARATPTLSLNPTRWLLGKS